MSYIAERLRAGQPREAVLFAWGICADGTKVLLHWGREPRTTLRAAGGSFKAEWPEFRVHVKACYEAPSLEMARALRQGVVDRYAKTFPAAVASFEDDRALRSVQQRW